MRLGIFRRRRVRNQAKKVLDTAAKQGVSTMDGLFPIVAEISGLEQVVYEDADLDSGVMATTYRADDTATIRVSRTCTTWHHTMAHEIGHLVLGHSHHSVQCVEQDLSDCPVGFEDFHLGLLAPSATADDGLREDLLKEEEQAEAEAELFATEILRLWRHVEDPAPAREWAFGLG